MKKLINRIKRYLFPNRTQLFWKYRRRILYPNRIQKLFKSWYRSRMRKLQDNLNSSIPMTTRVKPFETPHGLCGIFISYGARIGKGCTIFHQVTIGSNTLLGSKNCGSPTIGERVYIGAGAKIIGGITIGNDVRIGANCIVTEDVPANSTVVMAKPRIITYAEPRDNRFLTWDEYAALTK